MCREQIVENENVFGPHFAHFFVDDDRENAAEKMHAGHEECFKSYLQHLKKTNPSKPIYCPVCKSGEPLRDWMFYLEKIEDHDARMQGFLVYDDWQIECDFDKFFQAYSQKKIRNHELIAFFLSIASAKNDKISQIFLKEMCYKLFSLPQSTHNINRICDAVPQFFKYDAEMVADFLDFSRKYGNDSNLMFEGKERIVKTAVVIFDRFTKKFWPANEPIFRPEKIDKIMLAEIFKVVPLEMTWARNDLEVFILGNLSPETLLNFRKATNYNLNFDNLLHYTKKLSNKKFYVKLFTHLILADIIVDDLKGENFAEFIADIGASFYGSFWGYSLSLQNELSEDQLKILLHFTYHSMPLNGIKLAKMNTKMTRSPLLSKILNNSAQLKSLEVSFLGVDCASVEQFLASLTALLLAKIEIKVDSLDASVSGGLNKLISRQYCLEEIDISFGDATDEGIQLLKMIFQSKPTLKSIRIKGNMQKFASDTSLFEFIGKMRYLQHLHLQTKGLSLVHANTLARSLTTAKHLESLSLTHCELNGEHLQVIAQSFKALPLLQNLCLESNALDDASMQVIGQSMAHLKTLRWLLLDHNNVGAGGYLNVLLGAPAETNTSLVKFMLSKLDAAAFLQAIPILSNFSNLDSLVVAPGTFSAENVHIAASSIMKLNKLRQINFSKNEICDEGMRILGPALQNLKYLKSVNFSGTKITANGLRMLLESTNKYARLEKIFAIDNLFDNAAFDLKTIPWTRFGRLNTLWLVGGKPALISGFAVACFLNKMQSITQFFFDPNQMKREEVEDLKYFTKQKSIMPIERY